MPPARNRVKKEKEEEFIDAVNDPLPIDGDSDLDPDVTGSPPPPPAIRHVNRSRQSIAKLDVLWMNQMLICVDEDRDSNDEDGVDGRDTRSYDLRMLFADHEPDERHAFCVYEGPEDTPETIEKATLKLLKKKPQKNNQFSLRSSLDNTMFLLYFDYETPVASAALLHYIDTNAEGTKLASTNFLEVPPLGNCGFITDVNNEIFVSRDFGPKQIQKDLIGILGLNTFRESRQCRLFKIVGDSIQSVVGRADPKLRFNSCFYVTAQAGMDKPIEVFGETPNFAVITFRYRTRTASGGISNPGFRCNVHSYHHIEIREEDGLNIVRLTEPLYYFTTYQYYGDIAFEVASGNRKKKRKSLFTSAIEREERAISRGEEPGIYNIGQLANRHRGRPRKSHPLTHQQQLEDGDHSFDVEDEVIIQDGEYDDDLASASVLRPPSTRSTSSAKKRKLMGATIEQLIVGYAEMQDDHIWSRASGSVTLIRDRERNILVDCGAPNDVPRLTHALRNCKLEITDITHIICTHGHVDHIGNLSTFPTADVVLCDDYHKPPDYYRAIPWTVDIEGRRTWRFNDIITIEKVRGHTDSDLMVWVTDDQGRMVCIAVESKKSMVLRQNFQLRSILLHRENANMHSDIFECEGDDEVYSNNSAYPHEHAEVRQRIVQFLRPDIIIPGHGKAFALL